VSVPIKAVFNLYRFWSEDRGERPMTTIAFTRKLSDRGLEITGKGSSAAIVGYYILPPDHPTPAPIVDIATAFRNAPASYNSF
jgi:hypothetical protein